MGRSNDTHSSTIVAWTCLGNAMFSYFGRLGPGPMLCNQQAIFTFLCGSDGGQVPNSGPASPLRRGLENMDSDPIPNQRRWYGAPTNLNNSPPIAITARPSLRAYRPRRSHPKPYFPSTPNQLRNFSQARLPIPHLLRRHLRHHSRPTTASS